MGNMGMSLSFLYWLFGVATVVLGVGAATHALLNKRDPYAAIVWGAICLGIPLAGPFLYFILGINRIHRRAVRLMKRSEKRDGPSTLSDSARHLDLWDGAVPQEKLPAEIRTLGRIGHTVTGIPLLAGNCVDVFHNGEEAYPAMLAAIEEAKTSIWMDTYIFDSDATGMSFVAALGRAVQRGLDVRVHLDGFGTLGTWPRIDRILRKAGVKVARFLPPRLWPPQLFINLRNHRKLLIVDGRTAFSGGMNISDVHVMNKPRRTGFKGLLDKYRTTACTDIHFRIEGPVLEYFRHIFAQEWNFTTQEELPLPEMGHPKAGDVLCRTVLDGPDSYFERFHETLLGVISAAQTSVHIMTPYFLPQRELVTALRCAAMRGVDVAVILPSETDAPLVKWASKNILWQFIGRGVHIYHQTPPFAHTKLLLVDGVYSHVGSANLDPRSLRLNFELTVECFDLSLATKLSDHFNKVRASSREYTLADEAARSFPVRIRDAFCWLFSMYL